LDKQGQRNMGVLTKKNIRGEKKVKLPYCMMILGSRAVRVIFQTKALKVSWARGLSEGGKKMHTQ